MYLVKQGIEVEIHSRSFYPEFQKYTEEQNVLIVDSLLFLSILLLHVTISTYSL